MFTLETFEQVRKSGQPARLIPTISMRKAEERATSSMLASFMTVPRFAAEALQEAGAPFGKRTRVMAFTEVVFKRENNNRNARPDGLIVLKTGNRYWSALVESKVGSAALTVEQVEEYLDIAKELGIDAVITISNQFAINPAHSPVRVSRLKTRRVSLFHFSWMYLLSKATMLIKDHVIDDPEQAFILNELVRYLEHESSGVVTSVKLPSAWRVVVEDVQRGKVLRRSDPQVRDCVVAWHQLLRYFAISLSSDLYRPVNVALTKKQVRDAESVISEDTDSLIADNVLRGELDVPGAAGGIDVVADLARRRLVVSMQVDAPADVRSSTSVNWLVRQLRDEPLRGDYLLEIGWPYRRQTSSVSMAKVIDDPKLALVESGGSSPKRFTIQLNVDLLAKFKSSRGLVEIGEKTLKNFYRQVGQNIKPWVPKPPKLHSEASEPETETPAADEKTGLPDYARPQPVFSELVFPFSRKS
jgi:hypothetical protein